MKQSFKKLFYLIFVVSFVILIRQLKREYFYMNDEFYIWINESSVKSKIGCLFPNVDPFDPTILDFVEHPEPVSCTKVQPYLTYIGLNGYFRINQSEIDALKRHLNISKVKCYYRMFDRPSGSNDTSFEFTLFKRLQKPIRLKMDMVKVICSGVNGSEHDIDNLYSNLHAHPAKKQNKTFAKPTEKQLSVLLQAIDSVSFSALKRNMPLTYNYITKNMGMIMFEHLNKIGDNSLPNMMAVLTGKRILTEHSNMQTELNYSWPFDGYYDDFPLIWKNFSSKGYSIVFNEDKPDWGLFHYMTKGFVKKPVDYYYHTFWRALEHELKVKEYAEHCYANSPKGDILLDITKRHLISINDSLQFIYSFFVEYSHDKENNVERADALYANFWREMFEGGYLNKTAVIFMSDHGQRYGELRKTLVGRLESKNPFLGIWFPDWFFDLHPNIRVNLFLNSGRLTSTFDIYETLTDVLNGNYDGDQRPLSNRGLSHLYELPNNRSCLQAGVPDHYCLCLIDLPLNTSLTLLIKPANVIVDHLNSLLSIYDGLCLRIKLIRIIRAESIWSDSQLENHQSLKDYDKIQDVLDRIRLTIETEPNAAVFEASLIKNKLKLFNIWQVEGDVERLSSYGNTSYCIDNATFHYPTRVPGSCATNGNQSFDCGNGKCISFTSVRDCINDCSDGSDEACGSNLVMCDTNVVGIRCGQCAQIGTESDSCLDQKYARLCSFASNLIYKCKNTSNCVQTQWIMDGRNDCGDLSDENPCNFNRSSCDPNAACVFNTQTNSVTCSCPNNLAGNGFTCTPDPLYNKIPGKCTISPLQFDCGDKCIPIAKFRDCTIDCTDGSDEECWYGQTKCSDGCTCTSAERSLSDCPTNPGVKLCTAQNAVRCLNSSICILSNWLLDKNNDCGDFSDENACAYNKSNCSPFATCTAFPMYSNYSCQCKSPLYIGDGVNCVFNGSPVKLDILDKIPGNCSLSPLQFDCGNGQCIPIEKFRDCKNDCPDGIDETCWQNQVKCDGCKCVDTSQLQTNCMSAENCAASGLFQCVGGGCVFDEMVLDGFPSCTDNSDEDFCTKYASCPADSQCVYAPSMHNFTCGCPAGTQIISTKNICEQQGSSLPNDCAGYQLQNRLASSGVYTIYRPNCASPANCAFQVYCDFTTEGGGWTVIQQRFNGSVDFYVTWDMYKSGFGSLSNEFWIGNEYIYELTSFAGSTYELLIIMNNKAGTNVTARYKSFAIAPESDYYRLFLGNFTQGQNDNLKQSNNQRFGTKDVDTDTIGNILCGDFWHSGWWHQSECDRLGDLNVPYNPVSQSSNLVGIVWPGTPVDARMVKTKMMIRPVGFLLPNLTTTLTSTITTTTTRRAISSFTLVSFPTGPRAGLADEAINTGHISNVLIICSLILLNL